MQNRWSDSEASQFVAKYAPECGEAAALRTYSSRLLGTEPNLVLLGGGSTSVKSEVKNVFGERVPAIFVKASGCDLATIEPQGHSALDLVYLKKLRALNDLDDSAMVAEYRSHLFDPYAATPSIETLGHAFLPYTFIDHTHADAILAITNQPDGTALVQEALGSDVIVIDYMRSNFKLAKASADAHDARPGCRGMVWARHGLVTWGRTARESYDAMIELASRAEQFLSRRATRPLVVQVPTPPNVAEERLAKVAPMVRGMLAQPSGDADRPWRRVILQSLTNREMLDFVGADRGKQVALSAPLTPDHLICTKTLPLWIDSPAYDDEAQLRKQLEAAVQEYALGYRKFVERNAGKLPEELTASDSSPRVILLPGLGAICAGRDTNEAVLARDITAHTLAVKARVAAMSSYEGLSNDHLFETEYHMLQPAKLAKTTGMVLSGEVAVVTGAAGAIGSAISYGLLEKGCNVAVTDLAGPGLEALTKDLKAEFGERAIGVPLDVTDAGSVAKAFAAIIRCWGGIDLVIINAGVALVSSLEEMKLEAFQKLERVNTEGTLMMLAAAGRHFRYQKTGGDIVLVSTKNVFAPGAKFGAYSATKAASHQLARIASLEMADADVRVNMVAPDAVFSHGARRSGLWAEVGPDRMKARGLDEKGLEQYYQKRNLLKVRVTAEHVSRAVLYFATRQTPTTGATIPVDGGLPDATPR